MRGKYKRRRLAAIVRTMTPEQRRGVLLLVMFSGPADWTRTLEAPPGSALYMAADAVMATAVTDPAAWGLDPEPGERLAERLMPVQNARRVTS